MRADGRESVAFSVNYLLGVNLSADLQLDFLRRHPPATPAMMFGRFLEDQGRSAHN
jgi:hypothetical protein